MWHLPNLGKISFHFVNAVIKLNPRIVHIMDDNRCNWGFALELTGEI